MHFEQRSLYVALMHYFLCRSSRSFPSLSLYGCAAACGPHLFIRCELSKSHLMTPISPEPRKAAHSICSALQVSRLLIGFVFVNMLLAAPDGFAR